MNAICRARWALVASLTLLVPGVSASEGQWFSETTESAVYGKRHEAATVSLLPSMPDVHAAISVSCVEEEGEVAVKFMLAADDEARTPAFDTSNANLWGGLSVVGKGRTRLTDGSVPAASFVRMTTYSNEVELYSSPYIPGLDTTFLSTNDAAWNVLENLPIAIALQTSVGEVEFVVPRNPAVVSVLEKCARGNKPTAFTSKQYVALLAERNEAEARKKAEDAERALAAIPDRPAKLYHSPKPNYPSALARAGIGGVVVMDVRVDEAGRFVDVQLVSSSGHKSIDSSAMAAVTQWRWKPALKGGRPVASVERIPLAFTPPGR